MESRRFSPMTRRGRPAIAAILVTFALSSALTVALSISAISRARHHAAVVRIAARQQTLALRYVGDVVLAQAGARADPVGDGQVMAASARALLNGGEAPEVSGNDDETDVSATTDPLARRQLRQEERLVRDLTETGNAILAGRSLRGVGLDVDRAIAGLAPIMRLRVLAALTANVSLNAERTIGGAGDAGIDDLIVLEIALGIGGLLVSLILATALIRTTRRQTAHFRSLVTSSTDLVVVLDEQGCVYAGPAVLQMVGCEEYAVLGDGLERFVHPDDRPALRTAAIEGASAQTVLRVRNTFGEWRRLEAHITDLRHDRHVRGVVLNARDVTERAALEDELARQAFHDDVTTLPNRALFRDRLAHALTRRARSGAQLAVLLADLDGFKQVNDTLGHDAGDELLREAASRFAGAIGAGDTLARLGGDEFAVLLEPAGDARARDVAQAILVAARAPFAIDGREFTLGASIGIATGADGPAGASEMLRHADLAMYAAKAAGRGQIEVFAPEMAHDAGEQVGIERDLRGAVRRNELELHYQPELTIDGAVVTGAEALIRWRSPTRGLVEPASFIALAETARADPADRRVGAARGVRPGRGLAP